MNDSVAGTADSHPWAGGLRTDGVAVVRDMFDPTRFNVVRSGPDLAVFSLCPCCGLPMRSISAARFIADQVFPLEHVVEHSAR